MANELYPVFEIPTIWNEEEEQDVQAFMPGPLFDFDTGDFVLDGANRVVMVDGRDQYILWCLKTLRTQLGACRACEDYGIDIEAVLQEPDRKAMQLAFERTVTEALQAHPCTERVYGFAYEWDASEVAVTFIVKPKLWDAFDVDMNVVTT